MSYTWPLSYARFYVPALLTYCWLSCWVGACKSCSRGLHNAEMVSLPDGKPSLVWFYCDSRRPWPDFPLWKEFIVQCSLCSRERI